MAEQKPVVDPPLDPKFAFDPNDLDIMDPRHPDNIATGLKHDQEEAMKELAICRRLQVVTIRMTCRQ